MLTSTIPVNFSVEEVLRQIDNDPAATEREKCLLLRFQETQDELSEKENEIRWRDERIEELESTERKLTEQLEDATCKADEAKLEVDRLRQLVADLESASTQQVSHAG